MSTIKTTKREWTNEYRAIVNDDHYFAKFHRGNLTLECKNLDTNATEAYEDIHTNGQAINTFCKFINNN